MNTDLILFIPFFVTYCFDLFWFGLVFAVVSAIASVDNILHYMGKRFLDI